MRLRISHTTRYDYDAPVPYALGQARLRPKEHASQHVTHWSFTVTGGRHELSYEDHHRNTVDLISSDSGERTLILNVTGEVETKDTAGVLGQHGGYAPLWLFERMTPLTEAGQGVRNLIRPLQGESDPLARAHALMATIADQMRYAPGETGVAWTAEQALGAGRGVCQDMTHVFLAAAREMGMPARYVSGYLLMDDRIDQEATHAWAETYIPTLGWVGFDAANRKCPDEKYVRVATGLDYSEAAPLSGTRTGVAAESMSVAVRVAEVDPAAQEQVQQ